MFAIPNVRIKQADSCTAVWACFEGFAMVCCVGTVPVVSEVSLLELWVGWTVLNRRRILLDLCCGQTDEFTQTTARLYMLAHKHAHTCIYAHM